MLFKVADRGERYSPSHHCGFNRNSWLSKWGDVVVQTRTWIKPSDWAQTKSLSGGKPFYIESYKPDTGCWEIKFSGFSRLSLSVGVFFQVCLYLKTQINYGWINICMTFAQCVISLCQPVLFIWRLYVCHKLFPARIFQNSSPTAQPTMLNVSSHSCHVALTFNFCPYLLIIRYTLMQYLYIYNFFKSFSNLFWYYFIFYPSSCRARHIGQDSWRPPTSVKINSITTYTPWSCECSSFSHSTDLWNTPFWDLQRRVYLYMWEKDWNSGLLL